MNKGTARAFTQLRAEKLGSPGYTAVSLHGPEIRTQLLQLRNKYDNIIIDVGGRDTSSLRAALTVADISGGARASRFVRRLGHSSPCRI